MRPHLRAPRLLISLQGYRRSWLRADLLAGLTVWAVLVPESLAYATIAGVSPVVGLYAAVASLVLYALLGSSRHLVVGPMSATAALSAAVVAEVRRRRHGRVRGLHGGPRHRDRCRSAVLAGLLRLGFIASFISEPVLKGFIVGLALTIIVGQLPKLFGVEKGAGNFFEQAWGLLRHLGDTRLVTLVVGLVALARARSPALAAARTRVARRASCWACGRRPVRPRRPGGRDRRADRARTARARPAGRARARRLPRARRPAVGVLLVGFAEGLGAAKTYAARAGYDIDANRELLGLGAANIGAGLSAGWSSTAACPRRR